MPNVNGKRFPYTAAGKAAAKKAKASGGATNRFRPTTKQGTPGAKQRPGAQTPGRRQTPYGKTTAKDKATTGSYGLQNRKRPAARRGGTMGRAM